MLYFLKIKLSIFSQQFNSTSYVVLNTRKVVSGMFRFFFRSMALMSERRKKFTKLRDTIFIENPGMSGIEIYMLISGSGSGSPRQQETIPPIWGEIQIFQ